MYFDRGLGPVVDGSVLIGVGAILLELFGVEATLRIIGAAALVFVLALVTAELVKCSRHKNPSERRRR
jgi:hypothetical protein